MRRIALALLTLAVGIALGVGVAGRWDPWSTDKPDVSSIAQASLEGVKAQNRLTAFAARFTVAVTSEASRLGLSARKTLIVPGLVRYELDWAKLQPSDLRWNPQARTLIVDLPPLELSEPAVDLERMQEYSDGRLLMTLGNAETVLDTANRAKLRAQLEREARSPILMRLARDATQAVVERTFQLPLAAAGVEARVIVRFRDESGRAM